MAYVTLSVDGTNYDVELDSDGRVGKVVWLGVRALPLAKVSLATREAIAAKVQIARHCVALSDNRPHTYLCGRIDGHYCTGHNIAALLAAYTGRVESVDRVDNAADAARRASAVLALDKGISSRVESNNGADYDVVTGAGQRYRFCQV